MAVLSAILSLRQQKSHSRDEYTAEGKEGTLLKVRFVDKIWDHDLLPKVGVDLGIGSIVKCMYS